MIRKIIFPSSQPFFLLNTKFDRLNIDFSRDIVFRKSYSPQFSRFKISFLLWSNLFDLLRHFPSSFTNLFTLFFWSCYFLCIYPVFLSILSQLLYFLYPRLKFFCRFKITLLRLFNIPIIILPLTLFLITIFLLRLPFLL